MKTSFALVRAHVSDRSRSPDVLRALVYYGPWCIVPCERENEKTNCCSFSALKTSGHPSWSHWMAPVFPSISFSLNIGRRVPERTHLTVCLLRPIHGIGF